MDALGDLFLRNWWVHWENWVGTLGELAPKSKRGSVDALGSVVIEECYYVM